MELTRILKITVIIIMITLSFSCEDLGIIMCGNCFSDSPKEEYIGISINEQYSGNSGIVVEVYEGDYQDNVLISTFNLHYSSDTPDRLIINKRYTFVATYIVDGSTYIIQETITPTVKYSSDDCEEPCYYLIDDSVDLRLKYTVQ